MKNTKLTRTQALEIALSVVTDAEALEVLEAIKTSIEKANARKSGAVNTKKAEAQNEAVAELVQKLDKDTFKSYTDLDIDFTTVSNQKFTALMKKAVEQGLAEKGKADNKKVGYRLI